MITATLSLAFDGHLVQLPLDAIKKYRASGVAATTIEAIFRELLARVTVIAIPILSGSDFVVKSLTALGHVAIALIQLPARYCFNNLKPRVHLNHARSHATHAAKLVPAAFEAFITGMVKPAKALNVYRKWSLTKPAAGQSSRLAFFSGTMTTALTAGEYFFSLSSTVGTRAIPLIAGPLQGLPIASIGAVGLALFAVGATAVYLRRSKTGEDEAARADREQLQLVKNLKYRRDSSLEGNLWVWAELTSGPKSYWLAESPKGRCAVMLIPKTTDSLPTKQVDQWAVENSEGVIHLSLDRSRVLLACPGFPPFVCDRIREAIKMSEFCKSAQKMTPNVEMPEGVYGIVPETHNNCPQTYWLCEGPTMYRPFVLVPGAHKNTHPPMSDDGKIKIEDFSKVLYLTTAAAKKLGESWNDLPIPQLLEQILWCSASVCQGEELANADTLAKLETSNGYYLLKKGVDVTYPFELVPTEQDGDRPSTDKRSIIQLTPLTTKELQKRLRNSALDHQMAEHIEKIKFDGAYFYQFAPPERQADVFVKVLIQGEYFWLCKSNKKRLFPCMLVPSDQDAPPPARDEEIPGTRQLTEEMSDRMYIVLNTPERRHKHFSKDDWGFGEKGFPMLHSLLKWIGLGTEKGNGQYKTEV